MISSVWRSCCVSRPYVTRGCRTSDSTSRSEPWLWGSRWVSLRQIPNRMCWHWLERSLWSGETWLELRSLSFNQGVVDWTWWERIALRCWFTDEIRWDERTVTPKGIHHCDCVLHLTLPMIKLNSPQWTSFIDRLELIKNKSNREVLCIKCWQLLNCKQKIKHLQR